MKMKMSCLRDKIVMKVLQKLTKEINVLWNEMNGMNKMSEKMMFLEANKLKRGKSVQSGSFHHRIKGRSFL